jgi:hypothetical protein
MRIAFPLLLLLGMSALSLALGDDETVVFRLSIPMDNKPDEQAGHTVIDYVVHESGFVYDVRNVYDLAHQNTRRKQLKPEELTRAKEIVSALPESDVKGPKDQSLRVVEHTPDGEKRKICDLKALPHEMKELFDLLGGLRSEIRDKVNFHLEQPASGDSAQATNGLSGTSEQ